LVTTYTEDANGAPDNRYRDLTTLENIKWILEDLEAAVPQAFSNRALVPDTKKTLASHEVQPSSIRAYLAGRIRGPLAAGFSDPEAAAKSMAVAVSQVNPAAV